jgi:hypothetical protein
MCLYVHVEQYFYFFKLRNRFASEKSWHKPTDTKMKCFGGGGFPFCMAQ